jgi:hypothetical protein
VERVDLERRQIDFALRDVLERASARRGAPPRGGGHSQPPRELRAGRPAPRAGATGRRKGDSPLKRRHRQ